MAKWKVVGNMTVFVTTIVEAESEEDALAEAEASFGGLTNYVGNGGTNKLIGVCNAEDSIEVEDTHATFDYAEEVKE